MNSSAVVSSALNRLVLKERSSRRFLPQEISKEGEMENVLPRKTEKPWGYELLYAFTPQYAGKMLFVKKGYRLSLQYHKQKDESQYVQCGKVLFTFYQNGKMTERVGEAGFCLHLSPGTVHRIEALEDALILEVSTPQLSDVVRLEDDYGRAKTEAVAAAGK